VKDDEILIGSNMTPFGVIFAIFERFFFLKK